MGNRWFAWGLPGRSLALVLSFLSLFLLSSDVAAAPLQFQFNAGTATLAGVHTNSVIEGGYSHKLNNNLAIKEDFLADFVSVTVPAVGNTTQSGTKTKLTLGPDGPFFGIAESHWSFAVTQNANNMTIVGQPIEGQPGHAGIMANVSAPISGVKNKVGQAMSKTFVQFQGSLVAGTVDTTDKFTWKTQPTDPKFILIPGGFNGGVQKPGTVQNYPANWITEAKTNGYVTTRALDLIDEYALLDNANWDVAENAMTIDSSVIGEIVIGAAAVGLNTAINTDIAGSLETLTVSVAATGGAYATLDYLISDLTNGVVFDGDVTLSGGMFTATGDFSLLTWSLTDDGFGNTIEASLDLSQLPDMEIDVLAGDIGDATYWSAAHDVGYQNEVAAFDTSVPEPGTLALMGLGFVGAGILRKRRRRNAPA